MARRPDDLARNQGSGPFANDNQVGPNIANALPPDARAVVEPVPLATNQGGRARRGQWRVRFAPRWSAAPDPLTGWTGRGDPLETIELRFPDLETAVQYCQRQGVRFSLGAETGAYPPLRGCLPDAQPPMLYCWPTGPHALCCGAYPISAAEHGCHREFS